MPNPHDKLFKAIFSDSATAAEHFGAILPRELSAGIDLSALRLVPGSFVDGILHERHTDLLFVAPFVGSSENSDTVGEVLVYLLFEHQSQVDPQMAWRLLRYIVRIWERWRDEHPRGPLPPILPLVLYQGEAEWPSRSFGDLVGIPASLSHVLGRYVPQFEFVLEAIASVPESALPGRGLPHLTLLLLRSGGRDVPRLLSGSLESIGATLAGDGGESGLRRLGAVVQYVLMISEDLSPGHLAEILSPLGSEATEFVMTVGQQLVEEGKKEGKKEGRREASLEIAAKLLERGFSTADTAVAVGLSVSEVETLRR